MLGLILLVWFATAHAAGEDPFAAIRQDQGAPTSAAVEEPPEGLEVITRNLRTRVEVIEWAQADRDGTHLSGAVGGELFTQVVTPRGTWGTADLQLRLTCRQPASCGSLEVHNAYLEKRLLFGRLNLRAGHFQVPFALEALPLDTHTPIIQLSNRQVLGLKHDWGLGARGQLERLDYDLSWTVGSGMAWPRLAETGLMAGRVGVPNITERLGLGFSGALRDQPDEGFAPPRAGADLSLMLGSLALAAEGSATPLGEPAVLARATLEPPSQRASAVLQVSRIDSVHASWLHRAELELALRLLSVSRDSFLRLNLAREQQETLSHWLLRAQLYLLFGG
jgi:hypothetical protein